MQDNKSRSRLRAQLTKFTAHLSECLRKPSGEFVGEMLFAILASQDVKLSNVARSLEDDIPLIKTEVRLSRNLKAQTSHKDGRLISPTRQYECLGLQIEPDTSNLCDSLRRSLGHETARVGFFGGQSLIIESLKGLPTGRLCDSKRLCELSFRDPVT